MKNIQLSAEKKILHLLGQSNENEKISFCKHADSNEVNTLKP